MRKDKSAAGSVSHNSLVPGSEVHGNVSSEKDIRVDGMITGDLKCQAKVVIGPQGVINGNIFCQNALIEGQINGNVECRHVLDIRMNAKVEGDIEAGKLIIENGAYYNGTCKMKVNAGG